VEEEVAGTGRSRRSAVGRSHRWSGARRAAVEEVTHGVASESDGMEEGNDVRRRCAAQHVGGYVWQEEGDRKHINQQHLIIGNN
jgi:hypothetical protein